MIFYLKTQGGWRETQGLSVEGDLSVRSIQRSFVSPIPISEAEWLAKHGNAPASGAVETARVKLTALLDSYAERNNPAGDAIEIAVIADEPGAKED